MLFDVVLGLSVWRQEIGWEACVQNDIFFVECDEKS